MKKIKAFFGIEEKFKFEVMDLLALLVFLNVVFVIKGFWWAPVFGICNNTIAIVSSYNRKTHLNFYIMQVSLLILNIYFLTL